MGRRPWLGVVLGAALLAGGPARAGEPKEEPQKFEPVSGEEKARLLAAETPKQKALRAELARLDTAILFNANANGNNDLFIVSPDGSGLKQLTNGPESDCYPHLSPDGKRIVFMRSEKLTKEQAEGLPHDPDWPVDWKKRGVNPLKKEVECIWIMNADGSGAERLAQGSLPHWAPDGKRLAYTVPKRPRQHRPGLFDLEKRTEKVLDLPGLKVGGFPCFTPDGKALFVSNGPGQFIPLNGTGTDAAADAKIGLSINGHPCNAEISADGKWVTWVNDTHSCLGSWLSYAEFDPATGKVGRGKKFDLGWEAKTVNYFPDFSPCGRYFVYVHAQSEEGVKSWLVKKNQELYVARFPADGTAVRVTWLNAASQHPHWTRAPVPPEKKSE